MRILLLFVLFSSASALSAGSKSDDSNCFVQRIVRGYQSLRINKYKIRDADGFSVWDVPNYRKSIFTFHSYWGNLQTSLQRDYTNREIWAVQEYIISYYRKINSFLRSENDVSNRNRTIDKAVQGIDSAIENSILNESTVVYRGWSIQNKDKLKFLGIEEGKIYSDAAFLSTSLNKKIAEYMSDSRLKPMKVIFEIQIPKGSKALFVDGENFEVADIYETEIILPRKTPILVKEVKIEGNQVYVKGIVTTPQENAK